MDCIDIPLPDEMRVLPRAPPVALGNTHDHGAIERIQEFGRLRLRRSEDEIRQACNLAWGPSDLVVILERPAPKHNYSVSFEQFVAGCKTLNAVDDLIRFATRGARSIHTVTVLDAFSFQLWKDCTQPSVHECHDLLEEILRLKKPRVVLSCYQEVEGDHWTNQFRSHGIAQPRFRSETSIEGHAAIVVRSFHPATAVCYNPCNANYRALLIFHFVFAFAELGQPIGVPSWMETISERSLADASRGNEKLTPDRARLEVIATLRRIHGAPRPGWRGRRPGTVPPDVEQTMQQLLNRLDPSSRTDKGLDVARLTLLWNQHFTQHASYEDVARLLPAMGRQQFLQRISESKVASDNSSKGSSSTLSAQKKADHVRSADGDEDHVEDDKGTSPNATVEEVNEGLGQLHLDP